MYNFHIPSPRWCDSGECVCVKRTVGRFAIGADDENITLPLLGFIWLKKWRKVRERERRKGERALERKERKGRPRLLRFAVVVSPDTNLCVLLLPLCVLFTQSNSHQELRRIDYEIWNSPLTISLRINIKSDVRSSYAKARTATFIIVVFP